MARSTPLLDEHRSLGARLTDFGGWEMPLQYSGVVSEHTAVRTSAGLFDVSHLGKLRVEGGGAGDALQKALTADVISLPEGRATYALVLTDDGGCIDDVFAYRVGGDEWLVVPNASNVSAVADAIVEAGAQPVDEWDRWAILALQGPESFDVFARAFPQTDITGLELHAWSEMGFGSAPGIVARTGYTGEKGVELYVPAADALAVWRSLLDAGATPAGLGARDTLRLEMGYALYGHEITTDVNPLEAGLGWVLAWDTPFRGRDVLEKVKTDKPARKLFGVRCTERGVPRQGHRVLGADGALGEVTSGNFSPTLQTGIALALGARSTAPEEGAEVAIEARGRQIEGVIVKPPFIQKGKK
ncbi:MAG TPA: glycine cleavage system aminomethyltransferase GcvT [Actinomycetota bacterium]|nr:glycine cleavage system aminomethyltransferase GcvT [Actinomycetota bacterium]